jgi:hypothetical protein
VLAVLARFLTIVALCLALGFQWIALQSVAWTAMLIQNSKSTPFCRAVQQTFDGAHPCTLCHIVIKGKASEKKRDVQTPASKIDILSVARTSRLLSPRVVPIEYELLDSFCFPSADTPSVPPPRAQLNS